LCKRTAAYLTNTWRQGPVAAFDFFIRQGQIPVSRSI
jgi:hypothetical protein